MMPSNWYKSTDICLLSNRTVVLACIVRSVYKRFKGVYFPLWVNLVQFDFFSQVGVPFETGLENFRKFKFLILTFEGI